MDVLSIRVRARHRGRLCVVPHTGPHTPTKCSPASDRFYRPPGTAPPGSGLGMAIVKAIADLHSATITLDNGPDGHGLAVTVAFPFASPQSP